jgi:hypothetical protein
LSNCEDYGNYKVSVHSGSDKFSAYPAIGKWTAGRLHVKTAGTSWLEAVRVIAVKEPALYRQSSTCARFVSGSVEILSYYRGFFQNRPLDQTPDQKLPEYLDQPSRANLSISFMDL